jgi:predicted transcriptional regulator
VEVNDLPQSERSNTIKEFLKWLEAKTKQNGATLQECLKHLQIEITEMGAQDRTCREYLKDCERAGLIQVNGMRFNITENGRLWLARKVS